MYDYNIQLKDFLEKEEERVRLRYSGSRFQKAFTSQQDFINWYFSKLNEQDYKCYYCETSIIVIRCLIEQGKLRVRKVKGEGFRGAVLEIDKKINELGYLKENCVLSCYYCNNDKSYTLDANDYKEFFGIARHAYFDHLFKSLNK